LSDPDTSAGHFSSSARRATKPTQIGETLSLLMNEIASQSHSQYIFLAVKLGCRLSSDVDIGRSADPAIMDGSAIDEKHLSKRGRFPTPTEVEISRGIFTWREVPTAVMTSDLERGCLECGLRMSDTRRTILRIIEEAKDHPSAEEVYRRALFLGARISVATVYRNIALLSRLGLLTRLEFGDRKTRYEKAHPEPHEHLIDVKTGRIVEFSDPRIIEVLKDAVAELGYHLINHRVSLFCSPKAVEKSTPSSSRVPRLAKENPLPVVTEGERMASFGSSMYLPRHRRPMRRRRQTG
jgi:Fur family transcriptional regulator, ferric uptake regulator